jgi:HSP20 family protein
MPSFYGTDSPRWEDPWATFERLRREMQSLLGGPGWTALPLRTPNVFPPTNLYDTADSLVLIAEVPGVREQDFDISVQGSQVVLRGQRSIAYPEGASAHRRERQAGSFHRTVELPFAVDAGKVEATYRNGVLMLRVPKPGEHQRRQIRVRAS